ncbi:hypothetical protein C8J57DRAFT_1327628 [Mycena rebaudengoi]|nr:hypothetical protein C8J57DRAFT_1327628 [Mycena rebaudengoi]
MDSPFQNILNTNAVPSDAECQRILELLKGPREQSAELTLQIACIQQSLNDLTRKRDELQGFIDAHLALVSPARRLPDDIVREIFVGTLPSDRNCVISATEPPLLLGRICQTWRAVALSTPRLWASLHIAAPSSPRLEQLNGMVDTWLSRSGALPLSLSFAQYRRTGATKVSMLLETLIRYSTRWKHIRIVFPFDDSFEALSHLSTADVPILERVSIDGPPDLEPMSPSICQVLGAPNLRSLSLNLSPLITLDGRQPLRWEQLRHLAIPGASAEGALPSHVALDVLRQCVLLETCMLRVYVHTEDDHSGLPFCLEYMQELRITVHGSGQLNFFEKLVLPNLRCLEYASASEMSLMPLLSSARSVESLTLLWAPVRDLASALRLMPMLQELRLAYVALSDSVDLFQPLTAADPPLCPQLQRISLRGIQAVSDIALLDFIQARTNLHLLNVAHLASRHHPPLQPLIDTGLDVALVYSVVEAVRDIYSPDIYSPSEGLEPHLSDFASEIW